MKYCPSNSGCRASLDCFGLCGLRKCFLYRSYGLITASRQATSHSLETKGDPISNGSVSRRAFAVLGAGRVLISSQALFHSSTVLCAGRRGKRGKRKWVAWGFFISLAPPHALFFSYMGDCLWCVNPKFFQ